MSVFKDQMQCLLVVNDKCSSSVCNYNETRLNIEEDKNNEENYRKSVWISAREDLFTFRN